MNSEDLPTVGPYCLGQDYADVCDQLREVEPVTYAMLTRAFDDEAIYEGPDNSWLGRSWGTMVAVTGGKVYKVGLTTSGETGDLSGIADEARQYMTQRWGPHNATKENGACLIWDKPWGNIVFDHRASVLGEGVSFWYTWAEPFSSVGLAKVVSARLGASWAKTGLSMGFRREVLTNWNEADISRWCSLRAIEWGEWPLFLAQPIVPALLAFVPWWQPVVAVVLLTWLWYPVKSRFISVTALRLAVFAVHLKWPISIGMAIFFVVSGRYWTAVLAGLWPIATAVLMLLTPPSETRELERLLLARLASPVVEGSCTPE